MSEQRAPEDTAEGMLLGRCSQGTREPDIGAEDFLQHLGMDAVIALRPLADRKKSHIAETIVRDPNAHMSHAFGVTAQLDSQAVRAANEAGGTARHHETLATKVRKDRLGYD